MSEDRLNALIVEQEMAVNINYDAVIDDFKIGVDFNRRIFIIFLSEFYLC